MAIKIKSEKIVNKPILSLKGGMEAIVFVTGALYEGKTMEGDDKNAPMLLPIRDLSCEKAKTVEQCPEAEIICGTVLQSILDEQYEDDSYIGKAFRIECLKKEGKKYNGYVLHELELEV